MRVVVFQIFNPGVPGDHPARVLLRLLRVRRSEREGGGRLLPGQEGLPHLHGVQPDPYPGLRLHPKHSLPVKSFPPGELHADPRYFTSCPYLFHQRPRKVLQGQDDLDVVRIKKKEKGNEIFKLTLFFHSFLFCFCQEAVTALLRDGHLRLRGDRSGSPAGKPDEAAQGAERMGRDPEHGNDPGHRALHHHRVLRVPQVRRICRGVHHAQFTRGRYVRL